MGIPCNIIVFRIILIIIISVIQEDSSLEDYCLQAIRDVSRDPLSQVSDST